MPLGERCIMASLLAATSPVLACMLPPWCAPRARDIPALPPCSTPRRAAPDTCSTTVEYSDRTRRRGAYQAQVFAVLYNLEGVVSGTVGLWESWDQMSTWTTVLEGGASYTLPRTTEHDTLMLGTSGPFATVWVMVR